MRWEALNMLVLIHRQGWMHLQQQSYDWKLLSYNERLVLVYMYEEI